METEGIARTLARPSITVLSGELAAVQVGGPSGTMIGPERFDEIICYDALSTGGSFVVFGPERDPIDIARMYLEFFEDESCGYCAPCRIGGTQMVRLLQKVIDGQATMADLDSIRRLAKAMEKASLCGLGQTAASPVTSTLRHFENEYLEKVDTSAVVETHEWVPLRTNR